MRRPSMSIISIIKYRIAAVLGLTFIITQTIDASIANDTILWQVEALGGGSTGDFAPYLIGSNSAGRHAMKSIGGVEAMVEKKLRFDSRFSWSVIIDAIGARQADADYMFFDEGVVTERPWRPSSARIQQLWAGVKWRGVILSAGLRDHHSVIVDDNLSSGDLTLSNNAQGIPKVQLGFVDYQNIPFTNGWVQIGGAISYGKYTDNDALKGRYNYYDGHITLGQMFTYKRAHFRTRTDRPLSVTIGAQSGGAFSGTTYFYEMGARKRVLKNPGGFKTAWKMFIPTYRDNADGYFEGNHLGTWDLKATYRFKNDVVLDGYFQWLWEDGSGMARRNQTDGLWGASVTFPGATPIFKKAVVEYIDFRDQSGPLHWAPDDAPGTDIVTEATGGDNYYNNSTFNSWSNYGLGQGSSFPMSPLYNPDGSLAFKRNRTRGVHIAATGFIIPELEWTAKFSHGVAWGDGRRPNPHPFKNTSAYLKVDWNAFRILKNLSLSAALSLDHGDLRGNSFGTLIGVAYTGLICPTSSKH